MFAVLVWLAGLPMAAAPISLHPENPHDFLFRGKPTVLITSTEHYGAVLNGNFDAIPYLDELRARELNLTRTFSGTYREVPGSFRIEKNTLAPTADAYIAPWPRIKAPGAADGGNRFDLDRWNDAYFDRLKAFVSAASERGIVVEYVLFCPFYEEALWNVNPMNARNNVNGVGNIPRNEAYTGKHRDLQEKQEAFVRKAVRELNAFDNLYFEICNEPYFGGVTLEWQARIASVIVDTEKSLPNQHLIAQNIANGKAKIDRPNPAVSIFNFHYAAPPVTVGMNFGLGKAIGDDETGFRGVTDRPYRIEAWDFFIAGGSVFDHLDYSFTTDQRKWDRSGRRTHAGWRRAKLPFPVAGPETIHRGVRFREDGSGRQGHCTRRSGKNLGPGAERTGQGVCDLHPRRDQGRADPGPPRTAITRPNG